MLLSDITSAFLVNAKVIYDTWFPHKWSLCKGINLNKGKPYVVCRKTSADYLSRFQPISKLPQRYNKKRGKFWLQSQTNTCYEIRVPRRVFCWRQFTFYEHGNHYSSKPWFSINTKNVCELKFSKGWFSIDTNNVRGLTFLDIWEATIWKIFWIQ